jgi:hypothetical protein
MERVKKNVTVTIPEVKSAIHKTVEMVKHEVEAEFCLLEGGSEMLPFDELTRLAKQFEVPLPTMTSSGHAQDSPYYSNKPEWFTPKHPFDKVIRYYCTYLINIHGIFFTGEGSAGADNVGGWKFRSYAFEIAHKRGKARCIVAALGLEGVVTDIEINPLSLNKEYVGENVPEDMPMAKPSFIPNDEPQVSMNMASKQQRVSLFRIFARVADKKDATEITGKDIYGAFEIAGRPDLAKAFLEHNLGGKPEILVFETTTWKLSDAEDILEFVNATDASKLIVQLGNFSAGAQQKQSNAIGTSGK